MERPTSAAPNRPCNPYHIALGFGLERFFIYLQTIGGAEGKAHVVVEKRGKQEDAELELEFRRVCDGSNYLRRPLPFEIVFADKKCNSAGLQMADLIARPIGVKMLRHDQPNRAYGIIEGKFFRNENEQFKDWGLKCFPCKTKGPDVSAKASCRPRIPSP